MTLPRLQLPWARGPDALDAKQPSHPVGHAVSPAIKPRERRIPACAAIEGAHYDEAAAAGTPTSEPPADPLTDLLLPALMCSHGEMQVPESERCEVEAVPADRL